MNFFKENSKKKLRFTIEDDFLQIKGTADLMSRPACRKIFSSGKEEKRSNSSALARLF